ncbi:MAG: hypothetical protein OXH84_03415 [Gammaproteobacteria bacterium]|nr:hypothetical protein [Gammaproteobacteria bacterium]
MKRTILMLGVILTLILPSSGATYNSSGLQPDQLPPGTWSYGKCKTNIGILEWCGPECLNVLRILNIVHPQVIIKHTADGTGKETIVMARGFNPTSRHSARVHSIQVLAYEFATETYIGVGSVLVDWIMNALGLDENDYWAYSIVSNIIFNRIYPKPIDAFVYDERWKHKIPGGVFGCEIVEEGLDIKNGRLQAVIRRININSDNFGYKYHLKDSNSKHWAHWALYGYHVPTPYGAGL